MRYCMISSTEKYLIYATLFYIWKKVGIGHSEREEFRFCRQTSVLTHHDAMD